jgi:hypothetical protein
MGNLIVVDCEPPFGVGAPSVGDMTEFGAVDVNALRDGRVETSEFLSDITIAMATPYLDEAERCARGALLNGGVCS